MKNEQFNYNESTATPNIKAVHDACEALHSLDINHPEGVVLLASFKNPDLHGDPDKGVAQVMVNGCSHGILNALLAAASENPNFAGILIKAGKIAEGHDMHVDEDDEMDGLPDFIKQMMKGKTGNRTNRFSSGPGNQMRDNKPRPGESLSRYMNRMMPDMPQHLKDLTEHLDNHLKHNS